MSNSNILIYRAKKKNSDEYIEETGTTDFLNINTMYGFEHYNDGSRLWLWSNYSWAEIDKSTLAIHFPSWIAKDEDDNDIKVFASFNTNKIGGDIVEVRDNFVGISGVLHLDKNHDLCIDNCRITNFELSQMTVTGIQK